MPVYQRVTGIRSDPSDPWITRAFAHWHVAVWLFIKQDEIDGREYRTDFAVLNLIMTHFVLDTNIIVILVAITCGCRPVAKLSNNSKLAFPFRPKCALKILLVITKYILVKSRAHEDGYKCLIMKRYESS